jgi:hypothetical protein
MLDVVNTNRSPNRGYGWTYFPGNNSKHMNTSIFKGRSFVCLSHWNHPNHDVSFHVLGTIQKPSMSGGASSRIHDVSTYSGKNIEYWTIFLLKIDWNQSLRL